MIKHPQVFDHAPGRVLILNLTLLHQFLKIVNMSGLKMSVREFVSVDNYIFLICYLSHANLPRQTNHDAIPVA